MMGLPKHMFSGQCIGAMAPRYLYLLRRPPRIVEQADWPTVQIVIWAGHAFLRDQQSWVAEAAGMLIAAVFLWDPVPIHFQGREA